MTINIGTRRLARHDVSFREDYYDRAKSASSQGIEVDDALEMAEQAEVDS